MILNVVTIVMLLLITGLWCTSQKGRGFFSSFLNMVCVIAAGAVAIGVWEPITLLILENVDNALVERIAPTAALLLPFCIALAILRLSSDAVVSANVDFDDATNFIGGMVCGAVSAVITTGIVILGLNFLGVGKTLMGHEYIERDAGNLVYQSNLWAPVDKITVAVYEKLSLTAFSTSTPLAQYAPNLHEQAALSRVVHETDKGTRYVGRASLDPSERTLQIKGRMTVSGELSDLLTDRWFPDRGHTVRSVSGEAPANGSSAEIVFLQVGANGAAEDSGQIVFTPGQIRMIVTRRDEGIAIHPHAVFAKASARAGSLTRFRFDDTNASISSPGRGGDHVFGFEFLVPPGFTPDSIIVRNVRRSLDGVPVYPETREALAGSAARDQAIAGGEVTTALNIGLSGVDLPAPTGQPLATDDPNAQSSPLFLTPNLPDRFGISLNRERGLTLAEVQQGRSRTQLVIRSGRAEFGVDEIAGQVGSSGTVATSFEQPTGQRVIIVPLKERNQQNMTMYGRAVQQLGTNAKPLLYDRASRRYYECNGFVHVSSSNRVTIQYGFTSEVVNNMSRDLPDMNMNGSETGIYLVFLADRSTEVTDFVLQIEGESEPRAAVRFNPPISNR